MGFLPAVMLTFLLLVSGSAGETATLATNTFAKVSERVAAAHVSDDGHITDLSKIPYVSFTDASGNHACVGTLVSPIFVLTTASCVDGAVTGFNRHLSVANIGVHDGGVLEPSVAIIDVVVHEKYHEEGGHTPEFDVAFVELETPFTVQPAVLLIKGTYGCYGGHLAAIGATSETTGQSEKTSFFMKELSIKSFTECTGQTTRNHVGGAKCLYLRAAEGQISVDRGSGVFCLQGPQTPPVLMGLAPRSFDAKGDDDASMFVDISSYVPWILKNDYVMETMAGVMSIYEEENKKSVGKILGARDALPGVFPYAVSVWPRGFIHECDGALISSRHVLTAAGCVRPAISRPYRAMSLIGDIHMFERRGPDSEKIAAEKILIHPDANDGTDLAIIVLRTESKASPINLPIENDIDCCKKEQNLTLFGWGPTSIGDTFSKILQQGSTLYYSHDDCDTEFDFSPFAPAEICGYNEQLGTSLCAGDVGTGLVFDGDNNDPSDDVLIGIGGSKNRDADCQKVPSRFTDVKSSMKWIEEIVKNSDADGTQTT